MYNTEQLTQIRKQLPKGSQGSIAEKLKLTQGYVSQVLAGQRNNDMVISAALDIIASRKKKEDRLKKQLQKTLSL